MCVCEGENDNVWEGERDKQGKREIVWDKIILSVCKRVCVRECVGVCVRERERF